MVRDKDLGERKPTAILILGFDLQKCENINLLLLKQKQTNKIPTESPLFCDPRPGQAKSASCHGSCTLGSYKPEVGCISFWGYTEENPGHTSLRVRKGSLEEV